MKPFKFANAAPVRPVELHPEVASCMSGGPEGTYKTVTIGIVADEREYVKVLRELKAWHKARAKAVKATKAKGST